MFLYYVGGEEREEGSRAAGQEKAVLLLVLISQPRLWSCSHVVLESWGYRDQRPAASHLRDQTVTNDIIIEGKLMSHDTNPTPIVVLQTF